MIGTLKWPLRDIAGHAAPPETSPETMNLPAFMAPFRGPVFGERRKARIIIP
jgi:hypothetical protein